MRRVKVLKNIRIKLNSFKPLCWTQLGVNAIVKYKYPPFIDGSCRREPDFQNSFPSISSLCRKGKLAPHFKKNDIIVYMTVGGKYKPYKKGHHIVAILQVKEVFPTHQTGSIWYKKRNNLIPSNCMVANNLPYDFDRTAGNFITKGQLKYFLSKSILQQARIGQILLRSWDNQYLIRSQRWPTFVRTKPLYLNLQDPPIITRNDFNNIFSKLPNTQTPPLITKSQLHKLGKLVALDIHFSKK